MPPKRKVAGQKKLEDTVDASPVTKKSRAGKLAEPVIEVCTTCALVPLLLSKACVCVCVCVGGERERERERELSCTSSACPRLCVRTSDLLTPLQDGSREELFRQRQAAKTGTPYEPKPRPAAAKEEKDSKPEPAEQDSQAASMEPVEINRAPVLTLWVAAVAQREGHSRESALTFGKAISGMLAQSKGKAIGVIQPKDVRLQLVGLSALAASVLSVLTSARAG